MKVVRRVPNFCKEFVYFYHEQVRGYIIFIIHFTKGTNSF